MTIREQIVELYGTSLLRRSAINIRGGGGVFEQLLSGKGYRTVVEIGTHHGCGTAEIAQYCDHVVTFDLNNGRLEQLGLTPAREELWASLGLANKITLVLIDNDREKAKALDCFDFDFAFVDGAHDYKSVKRDFEMARRCGRVLFHDYSRRHVHGKDDVCDFIDTLPKQQIQILDNLFAYWTDR
jgi:predicted O-methyltransferase YrrM